MSEAHAPRRIVVVGNTALGKSVSSVHLLLHPAAPVRAAGGLPRRPARRRRRDSTSRYNRDAVLCVGVAFGHIRPQWLLPHGGEVTVDGAEQRLWANYR